MTGNEIRKSFLDFFAARDHEVVPSAPLVPRDDPTLLFTNAGMVPFKNVFLGVEKRKIPRATSSQKCLRISGKHNDLEEVGLDTYHHTFFEMLGNWSFGDYYKEDAIRWAWELLTDVWKLPPEQLFATVFHTDDEAESVWRGIPGMSPERILRFGEKDNFWEMGAVGPCGPCSEIHIDRGPGSCDRQDVPGHQCAVNAGCARFIELWNLVFIQYNRDEEGRLEELPAKHVDTGMGLERIAAVLQRVDGNYDADLLRNLISFTERLSARRYGEDATSDVSFRVVADHARACAFMIADEVLPSNEGRGYVLRRILRRAARHGKNLGLDEPFLADVAGAVVEEMGEAYPELRSRHREIAEAIRGEEEQFARTLGRGGAILDEEVRKLREKGETTLPGEVAFRLYDTYGFPLDLTEDVLKADGIEVGRDGFDRSMDEQRSRARAAQKAGSGGEKRLPEIRTDRDVTTRFAGEFLYDFESEVRAIVVDGREVDEVGEGIEASIIVAETPFYAEGGGQVGDQGAMETARGDRFEVVDTQRQVVDDRGDAFFHVGRVVRGALRRDDRVRLVIDRSLREPTRLNHSVTHVLHSALREVLGPQVRQSGSLVAPDRLRFDFTHQGPVSPEDQQRIEDEVNARIRENPEVLREEMPFDEAIRRGALAFFGDKYGDRVRVVQMGDFSLELCGGTHVRRTGDIGMFKLRGESGVAAGIRRVEAVTGDRALEYVRSREQLLREVGRILKGPEEQAAERLEKLLAQQKELERKIESLQSKLAGGQTGDLLSQAREVDGVKVLATKVDGVDAKGLREMADQLRDRLGSGVVVLGTESNGKAVLLAAVTKDLAGRFHAGEIVRSVAPVVGGKGGGRPDFAQAGGPDPSRLAEAMNKVYEVIG